MIKIGKISYTGLGATLGIPALYGLCMTNPITALPALALTPVVIGMTSASAFYTAWSYAFSDDEPEKKPEIDVGTSLLERARRRHESKVNPKGKKSKDLPDYNIADLLDYKAWKKSRKK